MFELGNKFWLGKKHSEISKNKMREIALKKGQKPPSNKGKICRECHRKTDTYGGRKP